jgi:quercetin dioxygenase-like cupin family protein
MAAVIGMALSIAAFTPLAGAKDTKGGTAVLMPASDLKWSDVPDFPGLKMAVLEGDPAKGPNHHMIKLPGGFSAPLHHHSPDHYVTVLGGTLVLTVDGKEQKLPAGSYFAFKGKKPHMTKCDAGADCLLSIDSRGKWDIVPEEKKAAEKKK